MKINPATELKERSAALNTQLRFGRERSALMHAYQLRAFLQLRGAKSDEEKRRLEWVERVIQGLEKRKSSGIQRLIQTIIRTAIASLTPDDDREQTLLDEFSPTTRPEQDLEVSYEDPSLELEVPLTKEPELASESDETEQDTEPVSQLFPDETPLQIPEDVDEDWGWGGETVSSKPSGTPVKAPPPPPDEEDHWGGSGGYSYDDKF